MCVWYSTRRLTKAYINIVNWHFLNCLLQSPNFRVMPAFSTQTSVILISDSIIWEKLSAYSLSSPMKVLLLVIWCVWCFCAQSETFEKLITEQNGNFDVKIRDSRMLKLVSIFKCTLQQEMMLFNSVFSWMSCHYGKMYTKSCGLIQMNGNICCNCT